MFAEAGPEREQERRERQERRECVRREARRREHARNSAHIATNFDDIGIFPTGTNNNNNKLYISGQGPGLVVNVLSLLSRWLSIHHTYL